VKPITAFALLVLAPESYTVVRHSERPYAQDGGITLAHVIFTYILKSSMDPEEVGHAVVVT